MRVCSTFSFSAVESIVRRQRKARTEIQRRRPVLFHLPQFCQCQKANPISNPYANNPGMNSSTYKSTRLSTCSGSGSFICSQIPRLAIAAQERARSSQAYISPIGAACDESASGATINLYLLATFWADFFSHTPVAIDNRRSREPNRPQANTPSSR